mmetsp:Transcript_3078/g.4333  ORF Transcript_3078/g.4333 Transcript_3078/m.4333 type:complete len:346 (-) Transcript_3078:59-1096(-)|eukprot:CAMPEP_0184866902 /NCGR_PEP_ID=MMETSP0580-20130426/24205_1 /TAXON_ID=1118495 /ORGANISM="Dactyliosolen fragilissimus" /LENGTH=345 /DNA_ID=CAMNT_0027366837 /DNA_START=45 /DNA_END=1082 /DNA_ORIENTATION=-
MGERKVLNKYIPADFDPKLVPRGKKPVDGLVPVRMMLPFSIQCENCSSFLYRGRKFNSKKEPVKGSDGKYLGIQRYRFYIKCNTCSRPLTFLTDPKNADYEMESGGTRNYEVHRDKERTENDISAEKAVEEKEDPMKALENRVLASAREMEDLDNLDEIKAMNMRNLKLLSAISSKSGGGIIQSAATVLEPTSSNYHHQDPDDDYSSIDNNNSNNNNKIDLTEEDEALVRSIRFGKNRREVPKDSFVRLGEDEENEIERLRIQKQESMKLQQLQMLQKGQMKKKRSGFSNVLMIKSKRRRGAGGGAGSVTNQFGANNGDLAKKKEMDESTNALGSLLGDYDSESD